MLGDVMSLIDGISREVSVSAISIDWAAQRSAADEKEDSRDDDKESKPDKPNFPRVRTVPRNPPPRRTLP